MFNGILYGGDSVSIGYINDKIFFVEKNDGIGVIFDGGEPEWC